MEGKFRGLRHRYHSEGPKESVKMVQSSSSVRSQVLGQFFLVFLGFINKTAVFTGFTGLQVPYR